MIKQRLKKIVSYNCRHWCLLVFVSLVLPQALPAQVNTLKVMEVASPGAFALATSARAAGLVYDTTDAKVVAIAMHLLQGDVKRVTQKNLQVNASLASASPVVIAGTLGQSKAIDQLVATKQINVSAIAGTWERFIIQAMAPGRLVIAGSDARGTAYGILQLSKMMGISPWEWWADAVPQPKSQLYVSGRYTSAAPSVKYRGIFINDEDWGLQPWAAKTFEPETGDIGPKTYAKVFELLLRLKANLIWPAMHPSTKAFFTIPGNAKVAADYAIVIGSSHAEPMLRNNVGEWDEKTMGHFNYLANKDKVLQYWESRVKESSKVNAMYTLGMRGVHDGKMEGVNSSQEAVPVLEDIIATQRGMLQKFVDSNLHQIPQVFTAYKEVLDIYDNGLKLPEDITVIWPDDNYGYILRLNNPAEKKREGGAGVYYHASYWGRPHDYLWLSSTHPALIREEMMKAYGNGSKNVWVLNVGDIKPLEYNIELFMDMAWNAAPFADPAYVQKHLQQWAATIFGQKNGAAVQALLWEYYRLAFERRPEFMGWSQTEPTTKTMLTSYNHFDHGDEAQRRIDQYQALENKVKQLGKSMPQKDLAAFYELVQYPATGASLMSKKFLYRDKYVKYALQNRLSAFDYAKASQTAYDSIVAATKKYNQLLNGKWANIMSLKPRNLPVFDAPVLAPVALNRQAGWDVKPEGSAPADSMLAENTIERLPAFDNVYRQSYFIDVFLVDSLAVNWITTSKAKWIQLSQSSGRLRPAAGIRQQRLQVKIDWALVPAQVSFSDTLWFKGAGRAIPVLVQANKYNIGNFKGFVENNKMLAMQASHYNSAGKKPVGEWKRLPGLGYSGSSLQADVAPPLNSSAIDTINISRDKPWVQYEFYTFNSAPATIILFSLPTHPLNNLAGMRYAVSIDNGPVQIVNFRTEGRSEEWKQHVLRNRAEKNVTVGNLDKGRHNLRIYAIDPGVILDEIRIDLGGLRPAYSLIKETSIR